MDLADFTGHCLLPSHPIAALSFILSPKTETLRSPATVALFLIVTFKHSQSPDDFPETALISALIQARSSPCFDYCNSLPQGLQTLSPQSIFYSQPGDS